MALAAAVFPAKFLVLQPGATGFNPETAVGLVGTVGFTKAVASGNHRHGFGIVHCHASKGFANVVGCQGRVGIAVGPLGVNVNQPHLHRGQGVVQLAFAGIPLIRQHDGFGPPVHQIRLPVVRPSAGEAKGFEAHVLHGDGAGQDHEVGPGHLPAVLLFNRPHQPAGLVQVAVVGPTVEGFKALLAAPGAATAVGYPVGTCTVPCHANEERAVMSIVSRPPVLGVGQGGTDVRLQCFHIDLGEFCRVVEVCPVRVGIGVVLAQGCQIDTLRPPESGGFGEGVVRLHGPGQGRGQRYGYSECFQSIHFWFSPV